MADEGRSGLSLIPVLWLECEKLILLYPQILSKNQKFDVFSAHGLSPDKLGDNRLQRSRGAFLGQRRSVCPQKGDGLTHGRKCPPKRSGGPQHRRSSPYSKFASPLRPCKVGLKGEFSPAILRPKLVLRLIRLVVFKRDDAGTFKIYKRSLEDLEEINKLSGKRLKSIGRKK